ncbi:putative solute carrier family 35 member SLC35F1/F2/F6 [Helianthus anomalus]
MCLNSPVTLVLFGYLALTIVYGSILLYRRHELVIPWYWYALLAFFDVQGNYLCRFSSLHLLHFRLFFMQLNLPQLNYNSVD